MITIKQNQFNKYSKFAQHIDWLYFAATFERLRSDVKTIKYKQNEDIKIEFELDFGVSKQHDPTKFKNIGDKASSMDKVITTLLIE